MLASGRIIPTILRKGWRFPGFRPLPTPWSFNSALELSRASLVAQLVKNLPAMQEAWVRSLVWKDPLEKGTATHSRILQYSGLENSTDCIAHGVAKSRTRLSHFHFGTVKAPLGVSFHLLIED